MRKTSKWLLWVGTISFVLVSIPAVVWLSLTYQPSYYRALSHSSRAKRADQAKKFVAQSLQLRNDICNEPTWEAVFSDEEVNAWLAEDLITHFADQLPPEVNEPRLLFELDRITLAFQLHQRGIHSVITVVARPRVPEGNTVELTLEKIRAGILPVPADSFLDRIVDYARYHGVDVQWSRKDGYPVVVIRYTPNLEREDVRLEATSDLQRSDPAGRPLGPGQRGLSLADAPFSVGASVQVSHAKDPAGRARRFPAGQPQLHLAGQLKAL